MLPTHHRRRDRSRRPWAHVQAVCVGLPAAPPRESAETGEATVRFVAPACGVPPSSESCESSTRGRANLSAGIT
jgi:hypothetical protein